nr:putative receptor like protein 25 [Setaria viridis]
MVLRSNQFYGSICDMVWYNKYDQCFSSLQIIDLASNNFSGNLTSQWFENLELMMTESRSTLQITSAESVKFPGYQDTVDIIYKGSEVSFERILTTLTAIDFSNNRLEGDIPKSIGRLVSLRMLNMSHNAFTGKIPAQLGGMTDLESLDLSCNQISGEIPQELTDLTFLDVLNLSNNHLVGKIPQSHQFSTFGSSSFGGNAGLCGPPLSKLPCGYSPYIPGAAAQVIKSSHHVDVVLFLFAGLGFGVGFAAAIVVKWGRISRWFTATVRASQT